MNLRKVFEPMNARFADVLPNFCCHFYIFFFFFCTHFLLMSSFSPVILFDCTPRAKCWRFNHLFMYLVLQGNRSRIESFCSFVFLAILFSIFTCLFLVLLRLSSEWRSHHITGEKKSREENEKTFKKTKSNVMSFSP